MTLRGGRYEIIRVIASGGMAKVHLGRALGAGGFERLVAVKAMHPHLASEAEFIDMFLDEARLAARIRHPNVVGTLDVQRDEEGIFLVMEYVEGPSLQTVLRELRRNGRHLPIDIGIRVFIDALAGLHAAHELMGTDGEPLNLVHRDVSPQNILLGVDGVTRITDFGVARAESRLSSTKGGEVKGKIPYMAPEQIQRDGIDRRTDVYAAAVVFWEMLSGERLIRGDNDGDRLMAILLGERRSLRPLNPNVPEAIEAACVFALQLSPKDRYPTAAAFIEALEAAAEADGVQIAAPRAVAAFVKQLAVHESANDLPSSSSRPADLDGPRSVGRTAAGALTGPSDVDPPVSTHAAAVAPAEPMPRPKRARPMLFGAIGLGAVLAVSGGIMMLKHGDGPPQPTAAEGAPSPEPARTAAAAEAPTIEVASALTAATAPAASSSAAAAAAPRSGSNAAKGSGAQPTAKGGKKTPPTGPATSPTTYRPKEL